MKIFPTKKQYKNWSMPSKLTMWGTLVGGISLLWSFFTYIYPLNTFIFDGEFNFSISVTTSNVICDSYEEDRYCINHDDKLNYYVVDDSEKIGIYPDYDQISSSVNFFENSDNKFRFPELDIKIVNNSSATYFIEEVQLINVKSKKDHNLYFSVTTDCHNGMISLYQANRNLDSDNEINATLTYSVSNKNIKSSQTIIRLNSLFIGNEFQFLTVLLDDSLLEVGIDIKKINEINQKSDYVYFKYCGYLWGCQEARDTDRYLYFFNSAKKIEDNAKIAFLELQKCGLNAKRFPELKNKRLVDFFINPRITGYIEYSIFDYDTKSNKKVKSYFDQLVNIVQDHGCGDAEPPSDSYTIQLHAENQEYNLKVPISHSIKDKEVDRFTIKLGVSSSSFHQFRLKLNTVNGESFVSRPIEVYIPNM